MTRGTVANMSTGYDIHTVKIDTLMNVLWDVDYSSSGNHDDEGNALAIDPSNGNVYVGGFKDVSGQGTDFVTLMYNDAGSLQWSAMWNDTADGGDTVKALVVDASGNVTVTGSAWNGSSLDYHTVQYDDTGTLLWERSFNDKYNFTDAPMDIALTSDNGVVVTGQSLNPDSTWSYVTVKYLAHEFILPVDSDSVSTSLRWLTNRDQLLDTDTNLVERVKYYSNQCYPNLYFMADTLSYVFFQGVDTTNNDTLHRIDMTFNGANAAQKLLPMDKESYWNNYYLGHIPEGRPFVSLHDRLVKQEVWPNIDVVYSSNQRGLKYYIVVHPGGETGAISLEYHGYDALSVDGNEALVIESSIGELVQPQALAYEMDANGELDLLAWQPEYLVSGGEVTFDAIGSWTGDLVIEVNWGYVSYEAVGAKRWWGTYLGGSGNEFAYDLTIDQADNLYVAGSTGSSNFPIYGGSIYQPTFGGNIDAFVGKFNNQYHREWISYFGGNGEDQGYGVAHDLNSGTVFLCGETNSSNPSIPFPYQLSISGSYQDVLIKGYIAGFDDFTGSINWLTGFGGLGTTCKKIKTDVDGNIFVVGNSEQQSHLVTCTPPTGFFPICVPGSAYGQELRGSMSSISQDGFIVKFTHDRSLYWSTFFGGEESENLHGLAIDDARDLLYIVGSTSSSTVLFTTDPFPTWNHSGYFQDLNIPSIAGDVDGFIAQFSTNGEPNWSTFFGGTGNDEITDVEVSDAPNSEGYLMICGHTTSDTYAATMNLEPGFGNEGFPHFNGGLAFDEAYGGGDHDPFGAMFDDKGDCIWSSYLGGTEDEGIHFRSPSISVTESGAFYIGGFTYCGSNSSAQYPHFVTNSSFRSQPTHAGVSAANLVGDAYLFRFNNNAQFEFGTYFGGNDLLHTPQGANDILGAIECDDSHVYLAGGTSSNSNFPLSRPFSNSYYSSAIGVPSQTSSSAFLAQIQVDPFVGIAAPPTQLPGISIYPNPSAGKVTLAWQSKMPSKVLISVYNSFGQLILQNDGSEVIGANQQVIDLTGQAPSLYIVNIRSKNGEFSAKVILL
ncbi:MAG: SBBP repeat-containing protein [Bacteroidetes bacterium]|nr:SBBP repeat-containing protein [Bacteroidota bacterium]